MLRTAVVIFAGVFLGVAILASSIWVVTGLPMTLRIYGYYLAWVLTGIAVGLFVGSLQTRKADIVAVICLIPSVLLQYLNRYSHPATGFRLFLLLLGTMLELMVASVIARSISIARYRLLVPSKVGEARKKGPRRVADRRRV